jgi:hypothetical protein
LRASKISRSVNVPPISVPTRTGLVSILITSLDVEAAFDHLGARKEE